MEVLRPPTLATLNDLQSFAWFSRVGERHPEVSTAVVLSNWFEAITSMEEEEWENLRLDARNGYTAQLARTSPVRFRTWNAKVEAIKVITVPMVNSVFSTNMSLRELPRKVLDIVQWDVLHVCMEAEFSDCAPIGFFASNAYWYRAGHFPCGWKGTFPDGKCVIY